jgi:DNA-binding transcriptional ArsR family regulator
MNPQTLNENQLQPFRQVRSICRAIDHSFRLKLLDYLLNSGESSVTKMIVYTRQEQSVVSQHLAILRKANLVSVKRSGKEKLYSVNIKAIEHYFNTAVVFIMKN